MVKKRFNSVIVKCTVLHILFYFCFTNHMNMELKYNDNVFASITNNRSLRLKLALSLNLGEAAIIAAAKRRSKSLLRVPAPEVIKTELGLISDQELYNQPEPFIA